ncbi:MAG TPA: hypothetical protein VIL63_03350 [Terriglobales bacterium]
MQAAFAPPFDVHGRTLAPITEHYQGQILDVSSPFSDPYAQLGSVLNSQIRPSRPSSWDLHDTAMGQDRSSQAGHYGQDRHPQGYGHDYA